MADLFHKAREALGHIDILVNNAAYSTMTEIETITAAEFDQHYKVNVQANMLLTQLFVQQIKKDGTQNGRIINFTSGQGLHPMPDELAYATTKAAVESITKNIAPQIARYGITVNAIDPGATDTGWMTDDMKADLQQQTPMGRLGVPQDAARLALFLASDEAQWITGQIIRSRGGL